MGVTVNGALDAGRGPHPAPHATTTEMEPPTSSLELTCCIVQIPKLHVTGSSQL